MKEHATTLFPVVVLILFHFFYNTRKGGVQLFETHSYLDRLKYNPLQLRTPRHRLIYWNLPSRCAFFPVRGDLLILT